MAKTCIVCGKKVHSGNKTGYCFDCMIEHRKQEKIKTWLETGSTGIGVATTLRSSIRDYIYETQNHKCAICGMERTWNGKPINFILDHIDGDASNSSQENVRLICPNCDSQLDTYKSKNKHSARSFRTE